MDDRRITMQAISCLAQVAEAISHQLMTQEPGASAAAEDGMRCADHVEHIAQYDIENLPLATRMNGVAESMRWLSAILGRHAPLLAVSTRAIPTPGDVEAVRVAATVVA